MTTGVEGAAPGGLAMTGQLQHTAATREVPEPHLQEGRSKSQPQKKIRGTETLYVGFYFNDELTIVSPLVVASFAPSG